MAAPSMQMNDDNPYKQFQHDLFFAGDNHPRHGFANVGQLAESGEMVRWQFTTQKLATEADATTLVSCAPSIALSTTENHAARSTTGDVTLRSSPGVSATTSALFGWKG